MDIGGILSRIEKINADNLDALKAVMPELAECRTRQYAGAASVRSIWLRIVLFFLRFIHVAKAPKYVFQGLRHRHLIESLPASEVMVLAGRDELSYCRKMGYRFHWIGYLDKAFRLFVGAGARKPITAAIVQLHYLFRTDASEKRFLFLWEDTLPLGLTLAASLSSMPGVNIVCIAHGFFPLFKAKSVAPEGINCRFNLVWDASQLRFFKGSADTLTLVLGLPYEVVPPETFTNRVILVGHIDRNSNPAEYFLSLYHFRVLYVNLKKAGYDVSFRPHPQDDPEFVRSVFPVLSVEDKLKLFASGRRVYIGFASSLLFEAKQFGNLVIGLDTSKLPYDRSYDVDGLFFEDEYDDLPFYLKGLIRNRPKAQDIKVAPLSARFLDCIAKIDGMT